MVNFFVGVSLNLIIGFLIGCLFCYTRNYHLNLNQEIRTLKDALLSLHKKFDYMAEKINK